MGGAPRWHPPEDGWFTRGAMAPPHSVSSTLGMSQPLHALAALALIALAGACALCPAPPLTPPLQASQTDARACLVPREGGEPRACGAPQGDPITIVERSHPPSLQASPREFHMWLWRQGGRSPWSPRPPAYRGNSRRARRTQMAVAHVRPGA